MADYKFNQAAWKQASKTVFTIKSGILNILHNLSKNDHFYLLNNIKI